MIYLLSRYISMRILAVEYVKYNNKTVKILRFLRNFYEPALVDIPTRNRLEFISTIKVIIIWNTDRQPITRKCFQPVRRGHLNVVLLLCNGI